MGQEESQEEWEAGARGLGNEEWPESARAAEPIRALAASVVLQRLHKTSVPESRRFHDKKLEMLLG